MAVYGMTFLRIVPALSALFLAARQEFAWAAGFLALAVIFDGFLVLVKKRSAGLDAKFQLQIEGLTDLFAYGVCPALFCASVAPSLAVWLAVCVFLCSAIFRIARFNVEGLIAGCYRGLPITYNGYIFPAAFFLVQSSGLSQYQNFVFSGLLLVVSGFMVSAKLKIKELG